MNDEETVNLEIHEKLSDATFAVVELYLGDKLDTILDTQEIEQQDKLWTQTTRKYPDFSDKIIEIRNAMKQVDECKQVPPFLNESIWSIPFMNLDNEMAREFLADVLFSRNILSKGRIENITKISEEARIMATEMGLQEGWGSEQAKSITLEKAVSTVLQGRLRVTHQTQPKI